MLVPTSAQAPAPSRARGRTRARGGAVASHPASAGHSYASTTSVYLQGIDVEEIIGTIHARRAPMMQVSAVMSGPGSCASRRSRTPERGVEFAPAGSAAATPRRRPRLRTLRLLQIRRRVGRGVPRCSYGHRPRDPAPWPDRFLRRRACAVALLAPTRKVAV